MMTMSAALASPSRTKFPALMGALLRRGRKGIQIAERRCTPFLMSSRGALLRGPLPRQFHQLLPRLPHIGLLPGRLVIPPINEGTARGVVQRQGPESHQL